MEIKYVPKTILLATLALSFLIVSPSVFAQSIGEESSQPSQSYGASSQSDFQDAGFQQSGSSAASTASGSSDILKQVTDQKITVTGAPEYEAPDVTTRNNTPIIFWVLFIFSGLGLAALYIFQRKTKPIHTSEQTQAVSAVLEEPKPLDNKSKTSNKKPKKAKSKAAKKKTHR